MTEVLVCGHFNILHAGHCELLAFASKLGRVTVGINGEEYNKKKYGEYSVPLKNRSIVLNSNKYVSKVVAFDEETPADLIRKLRPKYFVKGPDYSGKELPEEHACMEVNTQLVIHRCQKIQNSSDLILGLDTRGFALDPWD